MTALQPIDSPINRFLAALKTYKGAGSGRWKASCPAHDDRVESLSVTTGTDGRVLLKCHAGCDIEAICGAVGLRKGDLFPPRQSSVQSGPDPKQRPRLAKSWAYVDENGTKLFEACRLEWPLAAGETKPKKKFSQRHMVNNEWVWKIEGVRRVLYRLPDVIEAVAMGRLVCIVEGEKCADALVEAGYCATTNPMGAGKWDDSYAEHLKGAAVAIFPDNDETGKRHAEEVAKSLHAAGCLVKVVKLPGLPPKGDVVDWFDAGGDMADLQPLIDRAEFYGPRRVMWRLSDLWKNSAVMQPPPIVVPRLAWAGRSTLLSAREKSGKSTLIGYATAQVSQGRQFLGEYCVRGTVLVVGLEEFLGDVARRLKEFDADGDQVVLVNGFLGEPEARPQEIQGYVEEIMPALVVVDSLVAYANGRGIDENDAAMSTIVQPLTDMAHATGTALVIVHHANKATGRSRGSTAIDGSVDVVVNFFASEKEDADPTVRSIRSAGRVPLIRQYDVSFDGDSYSLVNGEKAPLESRIVAVIRSRPTISTNDVVDAVGGRKADVIAALNRMQAEHAIQNTSITFNRAKWILRPEGLL